jgi:hypothetical protein
MMMSNTPSALQPTQPRMHRRQNSTPVQPASFEALKATTLSPTIRRTQSHRRGQSLDQRSPSRLSQHQQQQVENMVGFTNTGSIQPGQQNMRETQQQQNYRPGQQYIQMSIPTSPGYGPYVSGPGTPYEQATMHQLLGQANMQMMQPQYFTPHGMPMPAGMDGMGMSFGQENQHQNYFQHAHSVNNMPMPNKSMSQPDLRIETSQRPYTPEEQINTGKNLSNLTKAG